MKIIAVTKRGVVLARNLLIADTTEGEIGAFPVSANDEVVTAVFYDD